LALRPDLAVEELRGNVDTRLGRLAAGDFDAIVLAAAGLRRLGREGEIGFLLDPAELLPAAGQGTLVLQASRGDTESRAAAAAISDPAALCELVAERALVGALEADCDTPVGARAHFAPAAAPTLELSAYVGREDGSDWLRDSLTGSAEDPDTLGRNLAERLLAAGAAQILGRTA
ncbi:MAG TPA: hypothetical protein VFD37_06270, partial [Solirubrobacterales bacterium]|nr:hypothetical protein [Solirubrobacterales bacterium]